MAEVRAKLLLKLAITITRSSRRNVFMGRNSPALTLISTTIFLVVPTVCFGWLSETSDEEWRSGWGQGVSEAEITNGSGNKIYVACTEDDYMGGSKIHLSLSGDSAKGRSEVMFAFDDKKPIFINVDEDGHVASDCRVCAANFTYLVDELKTRNSVLVRFSDGRESSFSLHGSAKSIGDCKATFYY